MDVTADWTSEGDTRPQQVLLRVMATTDMHVHLVPYDYYSDKPGPPEGLAHVGRLVRRVRAASANTLLVDNGDFLQGTPLSDLLAETTAVARLDADPDPHPVIGLMNLLGYDAGTLGNHEFNYGLDYLTDSLAQARFPVVCANIVRALGRDPLSDLPLVPPWTILTRDVQRGDGTSVPLRIGLIGLAPPQIESWDRALLQGRIRSRDIIDAAAAQVPALRAAGADLVIALCHSGIGRADAQPGMENAVLPLTRVAGIDAIVAGHTHQVFPDPSAVATAQIDPRTGRINGIPVVMPGFHGSHLGLIDLVLDHDDRGWHVARGRARACPVRPDPTASMSHPDTDPDPRLMDAAKASHDRTLAYIRRPIGATAGPLHSYFAQVMASAPTALVAEAQRRLLAPALAETEFAHLPVLSAVAPSRCGGQSGPGNYIDIAAGPMVLGHAAEMYQYPNTPCALVMTGADIRDWLEQAVAAFHQIAPGSRETRLLNPAFPSYNFDILHGLTYGIDLSVPARFDAAGSRINADAHRITDLRCGGRPVTGDSQFVVITSSYRAAGGGSFDSVARATVLLDSKVSIRDAVIAMIRADGTVSQQAPAVWKFAPMPGTSVLFDTGPGALAHLDGLTDLAVEPVGVGPNGFETFRLTL